MADKFAFVDIDKMKISGDISSMFETWSESDENICVLSPHDDDAIIGAGYAISVALANGGKVYVFIFCRGNAGYSSIELKDEITGIRERETIAAYGRIGVPE